MSLVNKVGEFFADNLIAKIFPEAIGVGVTFAVDANKSKVVRGTILGLNDDGTVSVYAPAEAATEEFNGDGSAKTFTLTGKPKAVSGVKVGDTAAVIDDYNAYTGVVTLHTAPAAGTKNVVVSYTAEASGKPAYILLDKEVQLSDTETVVARAYRSGNFNRPLVEEIMGAPINSADEDELRQRDIIFTDTF